VSDVRRTCRRRILRGCKRLSRPSRHVNTVDGVSLTCPQQVVRVGLAEFGEQRARRPRYLLRGRRACRMMLRGRRGRKLLAWYLGTLPGASIPMGQGGHVPPIFMKGDVYGNVPPNTLRLILSSNSNNCCLLYFNATVMCSFTKTLQLLGDLVPQTLTRAPSMDTAGGLPSPRPPVFFYVPTPNNPARSTSLHVTTHVFVVDRACARAARPGAPSPRVPDSRDTCGSSRRRRRRTC